MATKEALYDVVCVSLKTHKILWVMRDKTEKNADAVERMAIMRQGVEDRFFNTVHAGKYNEGDEYRG